MMLAICSHSRSLAGLRCILINPFLHPQDLREEVQSSSSGEKHESGMNFGILVVATVLSRLGAYVRILDFQTNPNNWRLELEEAVSEVTPHWVGIGSLSVYSYLPTVEILKAIKIISSEIVTVVGGQNGHNFAILDEKLELVNILDFIVAGDGEVATIELSLSLLAASKRDYRGLVPYNEISPKTRHIAFAPKVALDEISSFLEYEIYPNFKSLWPVIEESRGCPFSCDFCANPTQGGAAIRYKSPDLLNRELKHLFRTYGNPSGMPVVLMTSIFGTNTEITREFFETLSSNSPSYTPRFVASTRVDLDINPYIDLVAPFFDQIHFGLESGSVDVIARMRKARNPYQYLERARSSFQAWHDRGVHTAANFIVGYLGETDTSIRESISFIGSCRENLDSVWGGGLMAYPDSPFSRTFGIDSLPLGATAERISPFCDVLKTYPISPSAEVTYNMVLDYTRQVHKIFFNEQSYYNHYKWYVGPQQGSDTISFMALNDFRKKFSWAISS